MAEATSQFLKHAEIELPIIGGAMYPCSNPELVAEVSKAGALGIVQPVSLTYVHGHEFREGLRYIRSLTDKPIGLNLLIEASSQKYLERNREWLNIALEEGVRFFITALGNPDWVTAITKPKGAIVYHDVTERKFAKKAIAGNVDGLICVNKNAGGHAGNRAPQDLFKELADLGLPLICAGGIGSGQQCKDALAIGYQGVQIGTRLIASKECSAHDDYKQAIIKAKEEDIVLSERITGVPVAVINTDYIKKSGTKAGPLTRFLLNGSKTKHLARAYFTIMSLVRLKKSLKKGHSYKEFFQAGKSVGTINQIKPVSEIMSEFATSLSS